MNKIFDLELVKKKESFLKDNLEIEIIELEDAAEFFLKIKNENKNLTTVKLKLDFIKADRSYLLRNISSDEVFFKTGQKIIEEGFLELLVEEEAFYLLEELENVNNFCQIIESILVDLPLSYSFLKKEVSTYNFLKMIKLMLENFLNQEKVESNFFSAFFSKIQDETYLFIENESSKNYKNTDKIKSTFFLASKSNYLIFEDLLTSTLYIREKNRLEIDGLEVILPGKEAHLFKIHQVAKEEEKLISYLYFNNGLKGISSKDFFKKTKVRDDEVISFLKSKTIVYLCMEMFIPELYDQNNNQEYNGAVDANFNGGLGILAGCTMEGFANKKLNSTAVIPLYNKRRVQKVGEDRRQVIEEEIIDYSKNKNLKKVINPESGEQLELIVSTQNNSYTIKVWEINRGGIIVYLLQEENVFNILYTGSRDQRLLQELVLGKALPMLLKYLDIKPAILHLNEAHPVLAAINMREWEKTTMGDNFFSETEILFTVHTPRAAGMEVFYTDFEKLEIPYQYKKIFDPKNEGKLDFTNAALELCSRVNTVSENQVRVVKERIFQSSKFDNKVIGIMNGSSKQYWMNDSYKEFLKMADKDIPEAKIWEISQKNKKNTFLNPKKPSAWAVRRIVDYKNQWPLLKDIIRELCREKEENGLGFQVVIGGMAHPTDQDSQAWIYEFVNWQNGLWRSSMDDDFISAPELLGNFFFLASEQKGLGQLLKESAILADVCLEIPEWDEEACGTSGMRALGNANICIDSSDGALEWLKEGKNSFILEPYSDQRILESLQIVSNFYYSDENSEDFKKFLKMKKEAFLTWQNILDIDIMAQRYAREMFFPALLAKDILDF